MTCGDCAYWSMWENECVHPCGTRLYQYTSDEMPACKLFEPEVIDGKDK